VLSLSKTVNVGDNFRRERENDQQIIEEKFILPLKIIKAFFYYFSSVFKFWGERISQQKNKRMKET
jgi:hypothetical protein